MRPLVVAGRVAQGVADFLRTACPSTTPGFIGLLEGFLAQRHDIFKCPYPMNALANDQAARLAKAIVTTPQLHGLRAVLVAYTGATGYAELFARHGDAGVSDQTETAERALLNVAAARARRHLFVLTRPSRRAGNRLGCLPNTTSS